METMKGDPMKTKICNVCKIEKSETEYYKKGSGLQYRCKQCVKAHIKTKYENCPNCGKQKRSESKLCAVCSRAAQREIYPQELINEVVEMYISGLSTWKIADKLKCSQMKIRRILYRNNVSARENTFINNGKFGKNNPRWRGFGDISGRYFTDMKTSAKKRGLEFSISIEFINNLYHIQNGKCAISGLDIYLPLSDEHHTTGDYTASVDRIDSNKGYTEDNIQFVHKWINKMKQNLQEDEFLYLCKLVVDNSKNEIKKVDINTLTQNKRRYKIGS